MFGFNPSPSQADTQATSTHQPHSKQEFRLNKRSGLFQAFDPVTLQLREQGRFANGDQVGLWRVIDQEGDEIHYRYEKVRCGALCRDGSHSSATGRGACSWHGGVAEWLYQTQKMRVGGTGKYLPIEERIYRAEQKFLKKYKVNLYGQELKLYLYQKIEELQQESTQLIQQLDATEEDLTQANQENDQHQRRIEQLERQNYQVSIESNKTLIRLKDLQHTHEELLKEIEMLKRVSEAQGRKNKTVKRSFQKKARKAKSKVSRMGRTGQTSNRKKKSLLLQRYSSNEPTDEASYSEQRAMSDNPKRMSDEWSSPEEKQQGEVKLIHAHSVKPRCKSLQVVTALNSTSPS